MKGFLLDENGDVVIENGQLKVISDTDLKAQTLRTLIGTNKGEWFMNENEGIYRAFMIGKGITEDMQRTQIQDACSQIDENLHLDKFEVVTDKQKRVSAINFSAKSSLESGEEIAETYIVDESNVNASKKLAEANATLAEYRSATKRLETRLNGGA